MADEELKASVRQEFVSFYRGLGEQEYRVCIEALEQDVRNPQGHTWSHLFKKAMQAHDVRLGHRLLSNKFNALRDLLRTTDPTEIGRMVRRMGLSDVLLGATIVQLGEGKEEEEELALVYATTSGKLCALVYHLGDAEADHYVWFLDMDDGSLYETVPIPDLSVYSEQYMQQRCRFNITVNMALVNPGQRKSIPQDSSSVQALLNLPNILLVHYQEAKVNVGELQRVYTEAQTLVDAILQEQQLWSGLVSQFAAPTDPGSLEQLFRKITTLVHFDANGMDAALLGLGRYGLSSTCAEVLEALVVLTGAVSRYHAIQGMELLDAGALRIATSCDPLNLLIHLWTYMIPNLDLAYLTGFCLHQGMRQSHVVIEQIIELREKVEERQRNANGWLHQKPGSSSWGQTSFFDFSLPLLIPLVPLVPAELGGLGRCRHIRTSSDYMPLFHAGLVPHLQQQQAEVQSSLDQIMCLCYDLCCTREFKELVHLLGQRTRHTASVWGNDLARPISGGPVSQGTMLVQMPHFPGPMLHASILPSLIQAAAITETTSPLVGMQAIRPSPCGGRLEDSSHRTATCVSVVAIPFHKFRSIAQVDRALLSMSDIISAPAEAPVATITLELQGARTQIVAIHLQEAECNPFPYGSLVACLVAPLGGKKRVAPDEIAAWHLSSVRCQQSYLDSGVVYYRGSRPCTAAPCRQVLDAIYSTNAWDPSEARVRGLMPWLKSKGLRWQLVKDTSNIAWPCMLDAKLPGTSLVQRQLREERKKEEVPWSPCPTGVVFSFFEVWFAFDAAGAPVVNDLTGLLDSVLCRTPPFSCDGGSMRLGEKVLQECPAQAANLACQFELPRQEIEAIRQHQIGWDAAREEDHGLLNVWDIIKAHHVSSAPLWQYYGQLECCCNGTKSAAIREAMLAQWRNMRWAQLLAPFGSSPPGDGTPGPSRQPTQQEIERQRAARGKQKAVEREEEEAVFHPQVPLSLRELASAAAQKELPALSAMYATLDPKFGELVSLLGEHNYDALLRLLAPPATATSATATTASNNLALAWVQEAGNYVINASSINLPSMGPSAHHGTEAQALLRDCFEAVLQRLGRPNRQVEVAYKANLAVISDHYWSELMQQLRGRGINVQSIFRQFAVAYAETGK